MDFGKFKKPIHFTCPKCHTDFEFAGGDIVRRKNELANEVGIIKAKMKTHRNEYGKDKYYHNLTKQLQDKENQLRQAKQAVQIASEQSEIHLFILFKKACKQKFGDEVVNKMLEECEAELSYKVYDMAVQKFNNFNNL